MISDVKNLSSQIAKQAVHGFYALPYVGVRRYRWRWFILVLGGLFVLAYNFMNSTRGGGSVQFFSWAFLLLCFMLLSTRISAVLRGSDAFVRFNGDTHKVDVDGSFYRSESGALVLVASILGLTVSLIAMILGWTGVIGSDVKSVIVDASTSLVVSLAVWDVLSKDLPALLYFDMLGAMPDVDATMSVSEGEVAVDVPGVVDVSTGQ